jgi:hypothetical protein
MSFRRRIALLLLAISLGSLVGLLGLHFSNSQAWFLAVPALVASGWLFIADPTACEPGTKRSSSSTSKDRAA